MTRKETNDALVEWVKTRAADYADDIALIAVYGSYVNGTAGERSDVDMYFVPRNARAMAFARTFILDGVGYDIYPRSWENLAALAALENPLTPCIMDAEVIFGDAAALHPLQETLRAHLADPAYMRGIAEKRFAEACGELDNPGYALMSLADVIAALNGRYFRYGIKRQYDELAAMPVKPADFLARYDEIVRAPSREACAAMLRSVGEFAGFDVTPVPAKAQTVRAEQSADTVASLYEEICSTFGKIYTASERGDTRLCYLAACCLAGELAWTGWKLPPLLDAWRADDLFAFAAHARGVESALVGEIEARGARIRRYASVMALAENIK